MSGVVVLREARGTRLAPEIPGGLAPMAFGRDSYDLPFRESTNIGNYSAQQWLT